MVHTLGTISRFVQTYQEYKLNLSTTHLLIIKFTYFQEKRRYAHSCYHLDMKPS